MFPEIKSLCYGENYLKNKWAVQNKFAVVRGIERNNLIMPIFGFGTQENTQLHLNWCSLCIVIPFPLGVSLN